LASFVASSFVILSLQLRKIMPICALLQRMGIFGAERINFAQKHKVTAICDNIFMRRAIWTDF
jgi:hypothetical protein